MNTISVRLTKIKKLAGWENLEVAVDTQDVKRLYLSYPAVETILNYRPDSCREKITSKSFKTFLGNDLVVGKTSGKIVNKAGDGTSKVTLISLDDFLTIAQWEAVVNRNIEVGRLLAAGLGDSIRSMVFEQLGIELTIEERQEWFKSRLSGKATRRTFTDAVKEYLDSHETSENYRKFVYSNCSDKLNMARFGKTSTQLQVQRQCSKEQVRDTHSDADLIWFDRLEGHAMRLIDKGMEPGLAVADAIDFYP